MQKEHMMEECINTAVIFVPSDVLGNGGGFWIDATGKAHSIAPWNPAILTQLTVGTTMLSRSIQFGNTSIGECIESVAREVIAEVMPRVGEHLSLDAMWQTE
ncbi:MAG: hypothetical protein ABI670_17180 [Chloroflexota bacterium]